MDKIVKVAVLGATGYVGLEIIRVLINHPNVKISFLGCENIPIKENFILHHKNKNIHLPKLSFNKDFSPENSDVVFLALPHGVSQNYVKSYFNKIKIIDLSADFRLDSSVVYKKNYDIPHSCPELLNHFIYGLAEINHKDINMFKNIAIPGCYPTSILLPLIPIIKKNLINIDNIIIDSKSGYSGAGKKFDIKNINNDNNLNFYNYSTNNHRHISEIKQELNKFANTEVNISFNPHILPNFRGMMSTIYCDLQNNIKYDDIYYALNNFYKKSIFIDIIDEDTKIDFFSIQNTNKCKIKLFKHNASNRIIIVSIIDNLLKGAAGQAVQCFNHLLNFNESLSLKNIV